jgi:hypothetical protein
MIININYMIIDFLGVVRRGGVDRVMANGG